jgi:RHS repeat-associated protein
MSITNYYTVEGEIIGESQGGARIDYLRDAVGSVTQLVPGLKTRYKPYGQTRTDIAVPIPFRFGWIGSYGYRATAEASSTHYVQARHYSSDTARWTTVDPLWPQEPAYTYVRANPTNWIDPTGMQTIWMGIGSLLRKQRQSAPRRRGPHRIKPHRIPYADLSGFGPSFSYGAYCGAANIRNPGWRVLPQDCVDACCQKHDRCLEGNQGAGLSNACSHKCCDTFLANCVTEASNTDCCDYAPDKWECINARDMIEMTFEVLMGGLLYRPSSSCHCISESEWGRYARIWWGNQSCPSPQEKIAGRS